ncbi:chromosome partitioning protein, ParB family [Marinospirillum alkaliphilum DSM 21637]|uniref:Probable chromosome-partitioning protein ParB n=1 Tax=Marinospirillum alkaliphilum DSM 21637 TaxID=1122209 RepID=A0A1K1WRJ0_9GAMM|nr:chromosome partitioning protein, ParB family [Marinospirillum alkaliphilum DSM 21637]
MDALLGAVNPEPTQLEAVQTAEQRLPEGELKKLPIEQLRPGKYQPRRDMHPEALEELAASIRQQGIMQPVVVRPLGSGQYEIIAGERRWRAAQLAGLDAIPALVREAEDRDVIALALIENLQREDLNPVEEALALQRLQKEFELTQQQVADAVGKSRSGITNLLRLLQLQRDVRRMLEHGDLEMGHARALLGLEENQQLDAARQVVAKGMSVRQTEALVRHLLEKPEKTNDKAPKDPDISRLEQQLQASLGAPVSIQHSSKGKGKLEIRYSSLAELDGILRHLR